MTVASEQSVLVPGPAGNLQARLQVNPDGVGVAVVCHPHPLHGGTMDNKVVYTLTRACQAAGLSVLRFNFRGAGSSEGAHDNGQGEVEDVIAAADYLQSQSEIPSSQTLLLCGFSFGGYMALAAASRLAPKALITVAPPLRYAESGPVPQPDCPWYLIQGDADGVVDLDDNAARMDHMVRPPELTTLAGAGHFFHGRLIELREEVAHILQKTLR